MEGYCASLIAQASESGQRVQPGNEVTRMRTGLQARLSTTPALPLLLVGAMLLALGIGAFDLPHAVSSLAWPATQGVVLTSNIRETG